jgi:hypothetical protein
VQKGGVLPEHFKTVQLDERKIWNIGLNVTGIRYSKAVEEKITETLQSNAVSEADIVYVQLSGLFPPGMSVEIDRKQFEKYFHFDYDSSGVKPDYDIERLMNDEVEQKLTRGRFVKELYQRLDEAKRLGNTENAAIIEQALYYGLDALHDKEIEPRESHPF